MTEIASVLVVDDNFQNLELVSEILRDANYQVYQAASGKAALALVETQAVDVILLDVLMPEMNGFEAFSQLHANGAKNIPIIFMTALNDSETIAKAFELGAADYIGLPVRQAELLARLDTQLQKRSLLADLQVKQNALEANVKNLVAEASKDSERLNLALEATGVGIWEWDVEQNTVHWSQEILDVFGVDETSFLGTYEAYLNLVHPEDLAMVSEKVSKSLTQPQEKYSVEHRLIRPDGEVRWIKADGKVFIDETGNPLRMLGTVIDITERKLEDIVLLEAQSLLQSQTETLMTINQIANMLYQSLDIYDLAVKAIDACCIYLGADSGAFYVLEGDLLRRIETLNVNEALRTLGETLPLEGSLTGEMVRRREMIVSDDIAGDKRYIKAIQTQLVDKGIKRLLSIPLSHNDVILGALNLGFTEFWSLEGDTRATLETIGKTIGLALSNAYTLEQLRQEIAEREKAENLQKVLFEISRATSRTKNLRELLEEVRKQLRQLLDSENFFVALYDEHKDTYSFPYWVDKHDSLGWETQELKGSLTDYVRRKGQALIITNVDHRQLIESHEAEMIGAESAAWLGAPLKTATKTIGVIAVQSYDNVEAYGQAELDLLRYVAENITWVIESKHVEEALKNSQEMFSKAFYASPDSFVVSERASGRIIQANQGFERVFGYKIEEVLGKTVKELGLYANSQDRDRMLELLQKNGFVRHLELTGRRKTGEIRTTLLAVEPIEIRGEACLVTVVHDVTEQKQAREALKNSETIAREFQEKLQELLEISLDLSRLNDLDEIYKQAVNFGRARLGYDRLALFMIDIEKDTISGTFGTDSEGNLRDERGFVQQLSKDWAMAQIIQAGRRSHIWEDVPLTDEWNAIGRGWNGIAVLWDGDKGIGTLATDNFLSQSPLRPYENELLGLYGAVLGYLISGKQTELARQRIVQRLQMLNGIDNAILMAESPRAIAQAVVERLEKFLPCDYVSVFSIDEDSEVMHMLAWNMKEPSLASFPAAQASLLDIEHLRQGNILTFSNLNLVNGLSSEEKILLTWGIHSFAIIPLLVDEILVGTLNLGLIVEGGIGVEKLAIASEISTQLSLAIRQARLIEEVQAYASDLETQVKNRTLQLEAKNTELEAFTYSVSHDLRSPLRAMSGFAEVLMDDFANELSTDARFYLERIRHNAHRMGTLIDDLLALSRLGRRELTKKQVQPKAILQEILEELKADSQLGKAEIEIADLASCEADPVLLKQLWFNLVHNAIKYSKESENPQIIIASRQDKGETIYSIQDNGIGFDMAYADKLFGVFQRLHTSSEYEGTGIGLATVHRIVERHSGRIWADSELNKGASFYFTIGTEI